MRSRCGRAHGQAIAPRRGTGGTRAGRARPPTQHCAWARCRTAAAPVARAAAPGPLLILTDAPPPQVLLIHGEKKGAEQALSRTAAANGIRLKNTSHYVERADALAAAAEAAAPPPPGGARPWVVHRPKVEEYGCHHT